MSVNKLGKLAVIGLSAAWIVGCSSTATESDSSVTTTAESADIVNEEVSSSSDQSFGAGSDASVSGVVVDDSVNGTEASTISLDGVATVFYFDFDKSIVRPEFREALAIHAAYLVANPDAQIVLEGHADERGTREYNMALGERRAKAISRYLTIQGVAASQIETVSFGEEVPVAFGHNNGAWELNRRVEVRYEQ